MKFLLIFFLFLNTLLSADYSIRIAHGTATKSTLGEVISGNAGSHPGYLGVLAIDAGYLLKRYDYDIPIDIYIESSVARFNEDNRAKLYEFTIYAKAYLNFFDRKLRLGLADGISYTSSILMVEALEAKEINGATSKILNYIDLSLDIDIGRVTNLSSLRNSYVGIALKHRSGIFGLINNVTRGGSNYNSIYIGKNF